jgi:hypothetical protein
VIESRVTRSFRIAFDAPMRFKPEHAGLTTFRGTTPNVIPTTGLIPPSLTISFRAACCPSKAADRWEYLQPDYLRR